MATVPANDQIDRQRIEQHAYSLWQQRGRPDGSADDDWFRAERELRGSVPTLVQTLYAFGIERETL